MSIFRQCARYLLRPFPGLTTSIVRLMARFALKRLGPEERVSIISELRKRNTGFLDCAPSIKMVYATRSEYKRLRSGAKEPGTIRWIDRYIQPGQVLFDIGANTGSYSLYTAAKLNRQVRVYAFEAAVNTYASLMENVALNTLWDCVFPLNVALSNRATLAPFVYASLESGQGVHQGLSQSDVYGKSRQHGDRSTVKDAVFVVRD